MNDNANIKARAKIMRYFKPLIERTHSNRSTFLLATCWPPLLLGVPLHGRHRRFSRGGVAQFTFRPWPAES